MLFIGGRFSPSIFDTWLLSAFLSDCGRISLFHYSLVICTHGTATMKCQTVPTVFAYLQSIQSLSHYNQQLSALWPRL